MIAEHGGGGRPPNDSIAVTQFMRRPGRTSHSIERFFEDIRDHLPNDIEVQVCVSQFTSTGILRRSFDMLRARRNQGQVNHVTGDVHFLTTFLARHRTLLTINDCVSLERLHGPRRWIVWLFWYWLPIRRCALISVISDATRRQVLEHTGCDPAKLRVIPACVSDDFRPAPKIFDSDRPRILHIGTKSNKNLDRHAAALACIRSRLVIVGEITAAQRSMLESEGVEYENYSGLTLEELMEQYLQCDLLLFASTYEGFGLPILEAQAVGRPVVTANLWSMPEVAGDAACLVDPHDPQSIRAGVLRVITDSVYRERLITLGFENVRRFRAEAVAQRYAEIYREIRSSGV